MKKLQILIIGLLCIMWGPLLAQKQDSKFDKEKLESARVAFITNRLNLKPDQAEKFWPMFNKYSEERTAIMKELQQIDRSGNSNISDKQAKEMIETRFGLQQKLLDKEKTFTAEIITVLSPSQALNLHQVNREFTRQVYRMQRGRERGGN